MSKEEDIKFLKIQTCVLKVNIHCDGCKQKVKKLLQKIDGVYTIAIDAEQGKVTVSGNVDPATLIKKLLKNGKHAELLAPKLNNNKNQQQLNKQFQKLQLDNGKGGQKDNGGKGGPKGGDGSGNNNQKGQQQQLQAIQQQMKGFDLGRPKDLKMPFMKDPKSVKFNIPEDDEGSEYEDEFDDDFDDDDYDDIDGSDDDFEEDLKQIKNIKPMNGGVQIGNALANEKKGGGGGGNGGNNGKKGGGGGINVPVQNKGVAGGNDGKNGNPNGKKGGGGGGGQNGGKNGNGGQEGKTGGSNNQKAGVPHNNPGGKKGGKNEMNGGNNPHSAMSGGGFPAGMNMLPLQMGAGNGGGGGGNFSMHPLAHMGNTATAIQGLPSNGGIPQGYFPGGPGMPPRNVIAADNPYQQQQYLAAMMQHQRMMMNGPERTFQPMAYARPPVPINYMPPSLEYTHFFSDDNTSSCSIM